MMTNRAASEGAMVRSAECIVLSLVEREELDRLVWGHLAPQQLALRTWIILLATDGIGNRNSAHRMGSRFKQSGVGGAGMASPIFTAIKPIAAHWEA
jgi:hypothetical protein